jgi:hypothetical protein
MSECYRKCGYQHFRGVLPVDEISAFADLAYRMITPYRGEILRQDGQYAINDFHPSSSLVKNSISNAHLRLPAELKPVYDSLRALITFPAISESLRQLDGAEHYTVHQTIIFISAQTTLPHLDSWSLDTVPHGFAHTLWIPLEDMDYLSGLPAVIPWPVGKLVTEAELGLSDVGLSFRQRHDQYCDVLSRKLLGTGAGIHSSFMRKGDLIVWGSLTPHFSLPSSPFPRKRLSLQVLVRPTHYRWGTFVNQPLMWTQDPVERISDRFSFLVKDN